MRQIADAGYLVAYWSKKDVNHRWARRLPITAPLFSCEAVLTEATHILGGPETPLRMLVIGDLTIDFEAQAHAPHLLRWLAKFADQRPDLADACVVRLAELYPRAEILTTDCRDFTVYRTLAGKPLRCVFPPT